MINAHHNTLTDKTIILNKRYLLKNLESIQRSPLTNTKNILTLLFARYFIGSFVSGFTLESFPRLSSTLEYSGFDFFSFRTENLPSILLIKNNNLVSNTQNVLVDREN